MVPREVLRFLQANRSHPFAENGTTEAQVELAFARSAAACVEWDAFLEPPGEHSREFASNLRWSSVMGALVGDAVRLEDVATLPPESSHNFFVAFSFAGSFAETLDAVTGTFEPDSLNGAVPTEHECELTMCLPRAAAATDVLALLLGIRAAAHPTVVVLPEARATHKAHRYVNALKAAGAMDALDARRLEYEERDARSDTLSEGETLSEGDALDVVRYFVPGLFNDP